MKAVKALSSVKTSIKKVNGSFKEGKRDSESSTKYEGGDTSSERKSLKKKSRSQSERQAAESASSRSSSIVDSSVDNAKTKSMIYLFIARDSDMFLMEIHNEPLVSDAKFASDIIDQMNNVSDMDIESRPSFDTKELIFDNLKLHLHYDVIFFGLITKQSFGNDKANKLLKDVRDQVNTMYKSNMSKILVQTNLEKNCLDKFLRNKTLKIMENHNTSISSKNLNAAFQKVDEVK